MEQTTETINFDSETDFDTWMADTGNSINQYFFIFNMNTDDEICFSSCLN